MHIEEPRVLMFAPLCYPPRGSEAIITSKLLLAAMDAGWNIDVISHANSSQVYPSKINGIWNSLAKIVHNINGSLGFSVLDFKKHCPEIKSASHLQSFFWVGNALVTALRLLSHKKYDFILSRANPQYGHMPALILSKWMDLPWIANWSDPVPIHKAPPPYGLGPSAKLFFCSTYYLKAIAKCADWHTFPSDRLRKYVSSYLPECAGKSSVVPHIALKRFRSTHRKKGSIFSLCHTGVLGLRKSDVFLEGVKKFILKNKIESEFSIKFFGPTDKNLQNKIKELNLDNVVTIEKPIAYEDILGYINNSSVSVVIEAPCVEGIFLPSKVADFVQAGSPILAISPSNGTLADIFSTHGGGIAADCRSSASVAKAIETLYAEWQAGTLDDKYGSDRLFHLFSEKRIINEYMEVFRRIKQK